ncbi:MAG TPA: Gfo/Idh/MocA family oxidoreductase [Anaerolineae bacterium]|nr:Gfo/Idh/MocA family oxidoreductase [Anaerolineae bacterium]
MNEKRVRWGLLSTARINERLIPCLQSSRRNELVAVASRSQARADEYAAQWNIPRAYGDYDALVNDADIDAIYISLPNHLHCEWAVRCANAGKHVLCEKPLALATEEVERMADAARANNVVIQEAAMMRFHPQTEFVRDLIASGTLGEMRLARGVFTFTLENESDIRFKPEMGGGGLWDVGSYCVRWFRTVLAAEPIEVFANQVTDHHGVDVCLAAQLNFENGMVAHFFSSMASFAHSEADILGTHGRIELDLPWVNLPGRDGHVNWIRTAGARGKGTFNDSAGEVEIGTQTFENANAYQDEIESMASSILDGAPPKIPLTDSWNNIAVIVALLESARVGQAIRLQALQPVA